MKTRLLLLNGFLIVLWFIYLWEMPKANSKYNSLVSSNARGSIAFYVIDVGYQSSQLSLDNISPRNSAYEYTFSVSNYKNNKHLETNAKYHIVIRTTTNLNLNYSLVLDERELNYNQEIYQDSDGMYFRIIKTDDLIFSYDENQDDNYTLLINFPIEYLNSSYQDILENIEILVYSEQIVE